VNPGDATPDPRRVPLSQTRQPFLGLALAAIGGILLGHFLHLPGWIPACAAAAAAGLIAIRVPGAAHLLTACAFAAIYAWQGQESPAGLLAARLGDGSRVARATGLVDGEPRASGKSWSFPLRVETLEIDGRVEHPDITVLARVGTPDPRYGDRMEILGTLKNIEGPRNPGQFDFAAWLALQGIASELSARSPLDCRLLARDAGNPVVAAAHRCRDWIRATLSVGISDDPGTLGLILATTLGLRDDSSEQIEEAFRRTGTIHLFSVSGLHVGMVGVILWTILRALGIRRRIAILAIIPSLFFYVLITGLQPASLRAAIMGAILLGAALVDRRPRPLNTLGAAAFLLLLADTRQLFHPGFQFSFIVVAAILLLSEQFRRGLSALADVDPFLPRELLDPFQRAWFACTAGMAGLCAVSLAAWLGSLPMTIAYFGMVSLSSIPANLVAVPISFLLLSVAAMSICAGLVSSWCAGVFNNTAWLLAKSLALTVQLFSGIPGSAVTLGTADLIDRGPRIVALDVGAGGATYVQSGKHRILIDCGDPLSAATVVLPFLRYRGVTSLDALILTHGDAQHIGGTERLLGHTAIGHIIDSPVGDRSRTRDLLHHHLSDARIGKSIYRAGDHMEFGPDLRCDVLYPPAGIASPTADDKALVLRFVIGGVPVLMTSDIGVSGESWLLENCRDALRSDILLKGQHRSGISGHPDFLRAVAPKLILTTDAAFPSTEHPGPEWLAMAARSGARVLTMGTTGAIEIRFKDGDFTVTPFLHARGGQFPQSPPR